MNSSDPSIAELAGAKILVLGDCMLDRYLHGSVGRISPEAPVPIVAVERESCCLGGSGNVAASIAALGGDVTLAGAIGSDADARRLHELCCEMGIGQAALTECPVLRTISKTRVVAGRYQQLLRLDHDGRREQVETTALELEPQWLRLIPGHDLVVLADYDKGNLPASVVQHVVAECRSRQVPCIVDPKKADFSTYSGATVLTPNVHEAERAVGQPLDDERRLRDAAKRLREQLHLTYMLITRGAKGMLLAAADGTHDIPAEVREVADVSGAGDTVVAILALGLARGWPMVEACRLASVAAGIAVNKPRTYVVQAHELDRAWSGQSVKIVARAAAAERIATARRAGHDIVFTNGCFDILHAGHLSLLERARKLGDLLVLGLNSDTSVRLNKGALRPAISELHRAALLAGLACVDLVVLFDEATPEALIRELAPDVLVKGGDYDPATIVGADYVRQRGGRVVVLPLVEGLSTTGILRASANAESP